MFEEEPFSESSCTGVITDLKGYWKRIDISEAPGVFVGFIYVDVEDARAREGGSPDLVLHLLWRRGKFRKDHCVNTMLLC